MFLIKHKLTIALYITLLAVTASMLTTLLLPRRTSAAVQLECNDGYAFTLPRFTQERYDEICDDHKTGSTTADSIEARQTTAQAQSGNHDADCNSDQLDKNNCGIIAYIIDFINILSGLVGIIIVIMIVVGGIQFSAAGDNPQAVSAAKKRIADALLALVIFIFMFSFLQWLVPGGIF